MTNKWFKPWGWLYLPIRWPGALLVLLAMIFCVQVFVAIDGHSHSVSDTLYGIYPFWGTTFLLWDWLVRRLAERLDGAGILLVAGESGSGKSSLLRAGLLPRLAAGALGPAVRARGRRALTRAACVYQPTAWPSFR